MRALFVLALVPAALFADFRYDQTTRITKGMVTKLAFGKKPEPVTSTTYMKGSRVATESKNGKTIIDFDKQLFTTIDISKKRYWQMTFAEMRESMEEMQAEMNKAGNSKDASMQMRFEAKSTGMEKEVGGFAAKQMIFTVEPQVSDGKDSAGVIRMVADSWHSEAVPGYGEYKAFYEQLKDKGAWMSMGNPMAQMNGQKGMAEAMRKMAEEMQKTPGIPVLTITRMTMPGVNMQQSSSSNEQQPTTAGEAAKKIMGGALGGRLGGFGRKKEAASPESAKASALPAESTSGDGMLFMESFTDASGFSSASISDDVFLIPADFTKTEAPLAKPRKR